MRQSNIFFKTQKEAPKEEISINSQLLIRAGFIDKLMAGVYSFLPLGFQVLKKIENIIREEMKKIGAQELLLPALHPKENWERTNRWKEEVMFKLKSRSGKNFGLGWTHEEIITPLVKKFVSSYRDLPLALYQIQDKFRDELRSKSGLLRGVEFIMKDLYSFHPDERDLERYYEKAKMAYFRIFKRCGIGKQTFLTLSSGGSFSKYSHEFQTVTPFGEDTIYLCEKCNLAINQQIISEEKYKCPQCGHEKLKVKKAIEVGNIFNLKDKFSKAFGFTFKDREGKEKFVLIGCYGIGLPRLMGAIVEVNHDEKGICWPREVAPLEVHLLPVENSQRVKKTVQKIYHLLESEKIETLYDDRVKSIGEKFVDCDLIGLPIRIVVSEKSLRKNSIEIKERRKRDVKLVKIKDLLPFIKTKLKIC